MQSYVMEDFKPRFIAEGDILEPDFSSQARHLDAFGTSRHFWLYVEEFEDAGSRGHRSLKLGILHSQCSDWVKEALYVKEKVH